VLDEMAIRISGLASGMDVDDVVSKLMKTERVPLDKLTQKKQTLEWQRDSYREINTKIKDLQESINLMLRPSTYGAKKVTSSNESAVTATGTTNATSARSKSTSWQLRLPINLLAFQGILGAIKR
jgi:flagellar hook-associated protein 2